MYYSLALTYIRWSAFLSSLCTLVMVSPYIHIKLSP